MSLTTKLATVVLLGGLTGCVAPPPVATPIPFVAVPGPTKTEAQFRQDDTTCRAAAVQLPPEPTRSNGTTSGTAVQPAALQAFPPPGVSYLRCMEVRNNLIEPLAEARPAVYAYYPAYPVYYRYGYPWAYPVYAFGFGYSYGVGFGYGFYGGRYGGYRGGYWGGFREGGYHGGHVGGYGGYHGGFGHR